MKQLWSVVMALVILVPDYYVTNAEFPVSLNLTAEQYSLSENSNDSSENVDVPDFSTTIGASSRNYPSLIDFEGTNFQESSTIEEKARLALSQPTSNQMESFFMQNFTGDQNETGSTLNTTGEIRVSHFPRNHWQTNGVERNISVDEIRLSGNVTRIIANMEPSLSTKLSSVAGFLQTHLPTIEEFQDTPLDTVRRTQAFPSVFDNFTNSTRCEQLHCLHGSKCVTDGNFVWCNCNWAHTGFLCESALPLYFVLGLIGAAIILLCLLCLNVLLCIKLAAKKEKQEIDSLDRKLCYVQAFNKTESTAIYANPANYYGSSTNIRTSSTLPRPRLRLKNPLEDDDQIMKMNGHADSDGSAMAERPSDHYQTFQRHKRDHLETFNRLCKRANTVDD